MSTYRPGQRVRIEIHAEILEVFTPPGDTRAAALKLRADVDGEVWYLRAPVDGVRVIVLSEPPA